MSFLDFWRLLNYSTHYLPSNASDTVDRRGLQLARSATERKPLDNQYIFQLILQQKVQLTLASVSLVACVASNLASPVISGLLFEMLVTNAPFQVYSKLLAVLMISYTIEPILSKVFVGQVCAIGERVQTFLRLEAFRIILMQKIEFFDRHRATELTSMLTRDLESFRQFIFSNVSRDRGLRALGEVVGSVIVLFWLSWRLGPVLAGVILATGTIAWIYKRQSKALEHSSAIAHARMTNCVSETISQIRTVRIYSGEALERERYGNYAADACEAGLGFANAKGWLECLNRGAIHLSLLCLYGLGGKPIPWPPCSDAIYLVWLEVGLQVWTKRSLFFVQVFTLARVWYP